MGKKSQRGVMSAFRKILGAGDPDLRESYFNSDSPTDDHNMATGQGGRLQARDLQNTKLVVHAAERSQSLAVRILLPDSEEEYFIVSRTGLQRAIGSALTRARMKPPYDSPCVAVCGRLLVDEYRRYGITLAEASLPQSTDAHAEILAAIDTITTPLRRPAAPASSPAVRRKSARQE